MLRHAIRHTKDTSRISFFVVVRNDNEATEPNDINLISTCSPIDIDDLRPAITIMLPEED
jgi:hypothetical protein